MSLQAYKSKRNFKKTSEPSVARAMEGKPAGSPHKKKPKHPAFVVQKHQASHLHYDFRLEVNGVLKSWAVPKGPPQKVSEKRLAIATEDHPLEYAKFGGVIPEGEYGAGTVELWDSGAYESEGSIVSALRRGTLEVLLKGKKLKGPYALIRTKMGGESKNWLFMKLKQ